MLCRVANRTPRAFTALNIHATRDDKTQGNCLWPLYSISCWTSILAKRRTMLATFCKVFGSGHLQDAKLSSLVLAHCWLSNLFCKLTNKFKGLMDSTPKFASCSSCTDAGFCTLGQHWQEICQIFDISSNNILDLLGLTVLGCTMGLQSNTVQKG